MLIAILQTFQSFVRRDLPNRVDHWSIVSSRVEARIRKVSRGLRSSSCYSEHTSEYTYRGADKSLSRTGRKQATATELLTLASHSKKKNQKFVRPTRSSRQQWPPIWTKNGDLSIVFFQSGRAKDLSAPLYKRMQWSVWNVREAKRIGGVLLNNPVSSNDFTASGLRINPE